MSIRLLRAGLPGLAIVLVPLGESVAHEIVGNRFFPATLSTDDPFVSDELSLPTISTIVTPDGGGTRDTELSAEISKRITPNLDIEAGERFIMLDPQSERSVNGFGSVELGAKYEFFENDEHETVFSLGVGVEIGGTGSKSVGADTFSTWQPAFLFGKGLGDLPDGLWLLRPLAGIAESLIYSNAQNLLNEEAKVFGEFLKTRKPAAG